MNILIQLFEIITLKRRPQDLQYDEFAAMFYVVFAVGLDYITKILSGVYSSPLAFTLIPNIVLVAMILIVLMANEKQTRFVQTCTALFGTSTLFSLTVIALSKTGALVVLIPFLLVWSLYITALIIKEALSTSWVRAVFFFIGLYSFSIMVLILIYPEFATETMATMQVSADSTSE